MYLNPLRWSLVDVLIVAMFVVAILIVACPRNRPGSQTRSPNASQAVK